MKKRDVMLNTEAHRPHFNTFAEALNDAGRREGWRSDETLRFFLEAGFRAYRGRLLLGEAFDKNEAEYMKIVERCREPKETMVDLSRMLGSTHLALAADPIDFIGPVFSALSASAEMGQFFTPHHLSIMMARMIVGDAKEMLGERRYITLQEPACGVGGMVLAANQVLREAGLDVARQAHWHMTDVDFRAICGAYIQCAITDTSAIIHHGNTLSGDPAWMTAATPAAVLYPKRFGEIAPLPPVARDLPTVGAQMRLL